MRRHNKRPTKPVWIQAKFEGKCTNCSAPIARGEPILFQRRPYAVLCTACGDQAWEAWLEEERFTREYEERYG